MVCNILFSLVKRIKRENQRVIGIKDYALIFDDETTKRRLKIKYHQ